MYAVELLGYDCTRCTAQQQVIRGCVEDSPESHALIINGVTHRRCPRRPILDDPEHYKEMFWLYRQKEKGYLTDDGGLMGQANYVVESFKVIDDALARVAAEQKAKDELKRKRAAIKGGNRGSGYGKPVGRKR